MTKNSYRQRITSQDAVRDGGQAGVDVARNRLVRAVWAKDDQAVPVVQKFLEKFRRYPHDYCQRKIHLVDFDVCPLAGDASRAAYHREAIGALDADDVVLVFSDALQESAAAASFFGSYTPDVLAKADAPVFWLGAAQRIKIELWYLGDTAMKGFVWKILHPEEHGRFQREHQDAFDDQVEKAVERVLEHGRKLADAPAVGRKKPDDEGIFRKLFGFFHAH